MKTKKKVVPPIPIKKSDVLICMIDEYRQGKKDAFDCHIISMKENGVDVCYLSGYRSRNDFVPWTDIVAKVDMEQPVILIADGAFRGHFTVFDHKVD